MTLGFEPFCAEGGCSNSLTTRLPSQGHVKGSLRNVLGDPSAPNNYHDGVSRCHALSKLFVMLKVYTCEFVGFIFNLNSYKVIQQRGDSYLLLNFKLINLTSNLD